MTNESMNFLKKDNFVLGILLGLVIPLIIYGLIYYFSILLGHINNINFVNHSYISKIQLLSILLPLLLFRYFMINKNYEKTGRGIIFIIFVYILLYFFFTLRP